jgi:hypothetical protein
MPIDELNYRKKQLVQELNSFIGLKKAYGAQLSARGELVGTVAPRGPTQEELDSTFLTQKNVLLPALLNFLPSTTLYLLTKKERYLHHYYSLYTFLQHKSMNQLSIFFSLSLQAWPLRI